MHYTYIIRSDYDPERFYYGSTADLKKRLITHNAGGNVSTKEPVLGPSYGMPDSHLNRLLPTLSNI